MGSRDTPTGSDLTPPKKFLSHSLTDIFSHVSYSVFRDGVGYQLHRNPCHFHSNFPFWGFQKTRILNSQSHVYSNSVTTPFFVMEWVIISIVNPCLFHSNFPFWGFQKTRGLTSQSHVYSNSVTTPFFVMEWVIISIVNLCHLLKNLTFLIGSFCVIHLSQPHVYSNSVTTPFFVKESVTNSIEITYW